MAHLFTCEGEGCTILSSSCYKSYSSSFTQQAPFHRIPFSGVHLYEWKKLTITGNSNVNHFHKSICRKKSAPFLPWTNLGDKIFHGQLFIQYVTIFQVCVPLLSIFSSQELLNNHNHWRGYLNNIFESQVRTFRMYLEVVHPVATIRDPYFSNLPEFVVSVCFSISIPVTGSSCNIYTKWIRRIARTPSILRYNKK